MDHHRFEMFDYVTKLELVSLQKNFEISNIPFRNLQTLALYFFKTGCAEIITNFVSLNPDLVNLVLVNCTSMFPTDKQITQWLDKIEKLEMYRSGTIKLEDIVLNAPKLCSLVYGPAPGKKSYGDFFPLFTLADALAKDKVSPRLKKIYFDLWDVRHQYRRIWAVTIAKDKMRNYFQKKEINRIAVGIVPTCRECTVQASGVVIELEPLLRAWTRYKNKKRLEHEWKQENLESGGCVN